MKIGKKQLNTYGVVITVFLCLSLMILIVYGLQKEETLEDDGKITIGFLC